MKALAIGIFSLLVYVASAQENSIQQTNEIHLNYGGRFHLKCKVMAVYPSGRILAMNTDDTFLGMNNQLDNYGKEMIIQDYPGVDRLAEGDKLDFNAEKIGTIKSIPKVGHNSRVLELYQPYNDAKGIAVAREKELAAIDRAEQKRQNEKDRAEAAKAIALKANQDAAAKGDAYGLMRMGERYRDGDGVDKDLIKAREYLKKAADAGSITAKEELSKLETK